MKKTLLALVIGFALSPTVTFAAPALLGGNLYIDTVTGSLGIGTTTPSQILTVVADDPLTSLSTAANPTITISNTNTTNNNYAALVLKGVDTNGSILTGVKYAGVITSHAQGALSADAVWLTRDVGSLAERMRLKSDGRLGLGTTTPGSTLSVAGNIFASSTITAASTTGSGLTDCANSATSKLLYTAATGLFSCGTDQTAGGAAVTSVSNVDSTLTISPTGGDVVASLNLSNPNTWTGIQTFTNASSTLTSSSYASTTVLFAGSFTLATTTAGTLKVSASGYVYSDPTPSSGGAPGGSSGQLQFNDSSAFAGAVGLVWNKITTNLGIGSTTPWAKFTVVAGAVADELSPLFAFGTTSAWGVGQHPVLFGYATTTGTQNYARVAVGTSTSNRDQFVVAGRIYQTSRYLGCDAFGATMVANIAVTDTPNLCGSFVYDANVDSALNIPEATSTIPYARLEASFTTTVAVNEGAAIRNWTLVGPASSTPVMETMVRLVQATSTTHFIVGFTGQGGAFSTHGVPPTNGVYFIASTTRQNWQAVTRKNGSETVVDTGVSTSSVASGAGLPIWQTLRVEAASSTAYFLINGLVVAQIGSPTSPATNMPTANLSPNVLLAKTQATGARIAMDVSYLRVWIASLR